MKKRFASREVTNHCYAVLLLLQIGASGTRSVRGLSQSTMGLQQPSSDKEKIAVTTSRQQHRQHFLQMAPGVRGSRPNFCDP